MSVPLGLFRVLGRLRAPNYCATVSRPTRFEHNQYVGDKRTRLVHDLDAVDRRLRGSTT